MRFLGCHHFENLNLIRQYPEEDRITVGDVHPADAVPEMLHITGRGGVLQLRKMFFNDPPILIR